MLESESTICVFLPTSHQISENKLHKINRKIQIQHFCSLIYIISEKICVSNFSFIGCFLSFQALGKADQAKNTAKKVSDDVTKALETVANISTILSMFDNL